MTEESGGRAERRAGILEMAIPSLPAGWLWAALSPPSQASVHQGVAGEQALTQAHHCIFTAAFPASVTLSNEKILRKDKGSHLHTNMEGVDVIYLVS